MHTSTNEKVLRLLRQLNEHFNGEGRELNGLVGEARELIVELTGVEVECEDAPLAEEFEPFVLEDFTAREILRDNFAMAALDGIISRHGIKIDAADVQFASFARDAYAIADVMLEARQE